MSLPVLNIHDETGWEDGRGNLTGTKVKILRQGKGSRTTLVKVPAGFHMDSHHHDWYEQQLVLEGEYESNGKVYPAGTYISIPPDEQHGPYDIKTGLFLLFIWDDM